MPNHPPPLRPKEQPGSISPHDHVRPMIKERALKKRRTAVRVACNACRQKKVLCNGERPTCARCHRGSTECVYEMTGHEVKTQLQNDLANHHDVIEHLRTAPENEALSTLRRLRSTPDLGTVLSHIRSSFPSVALSPVQSARGLLPPTDSATESELRVLHGLLYPVLEPIHLPALGLGLIDEASPATWASTTVTTIGRPGDMTGLGSVGQETGAPYNVREEEEEEEGREGGGSYEFFDTASELRAPTFGPPEPFRLCDSRLEQLDIAFWTKAPISNALAANAISWYLETDHAVFGFFDPDTFLSDLVDRRFTNCTSFLVSALLCLVCMCYAENDPRASGLSHIFWREAEQLWPAYRSSDSAITLSALMVFSVASSLHGKNQLGLNLLSEGRAMAERLHFFGVSTSSALVADFPLMDPERIRAVAHAAWGCYSTITLHCAFYGVDHISHPPVFPIPGEKTTKWPAHPLPRYIGQTFTAMCKLWSITQEVVALFNGSSKTHLSKKVPLSFAEEKYQKLLSLADTLSEELARSEHSPAHVRIFHTLYHITVMNIFRPFLEAPENSLLRFFTSTDGSPVAVFDASARQLERLLVEMTSPSNSKARSSMLNPVAMHTSNVAITSKERKDWRFYLLLSLSYWVEAVRSYPVFADIAQGYLSLAIQNSGLSSREARRWKDKLLRQSKRHGVEEIACSIIVDYNLAMEADHDIRAYELAQRFDDLALFEELINTERIEQERDVED